jgi:1,5-anhydro-D-fructose reductase (1,5-anhydro-D-mannitol-forming)
MIRTGVVGMGFIGQIHAKAYQATEGAQLTAVCDTDEAKLKLASSEAGDIAGLGKPLDLRDVQLYTDFDRMVSEANLDAVSIALPTPMHADFTIKALEAGLDVLCEKPMASNVSQCEKMIAAVERTEKILQIAHCIRFWPEYAKTKEIIDSGKYGKVKAATFRRVGALPGWSSANWMADGDKSGGALVDLHIHDSDYVQYVFGMPKTVYSRCADGPSSKFDHVITQYTYDDKVVAAEGSWLMSPGFGFEMSFCITLEKATIIFDNTREPTFKVCPFDSDAFCPEVEPGDGWGLQIVHFAKAVSGQKVAQITTPADSLNSVKIVLAERQSAQTGKEVAIE